MQCLPTYFWGLSSSEEETVIQSSWNQFIHRIMELFLKISITTTP